MDLEVKNELIDLFKKNFDIEINEEMEYNDEIIITVQKIDDYVKIGEILLRNEIDFRFDKYEGLLLSEENFESLLDSINFICY